MVWWRVRRRLTMRSWSRATPPAAAHSSFRSCLCSSFDPSRPSWVSVNEWCAVAIAVGSEGGAGGESVDDALLLFVCLICLFGGFLAFASVCFMFSRFNIPVLPYLTLLDSVRLCFDSLVFVQESWRSFTFGRNWSASSNWSACLLSSSPLF